MITSSDQQWGDGDEWYLSRLIDLSNLCMFFWNSICRRYSTNYCQVSAQWPSKKHSSTVYIVFPFTSSSSSSSLLLSSIIRREQAAESSPISTWVRAVGCTRFTLGHSSVSGGWGGESTGSANLMMAAPHLGPAGSLAVWPLTYSLVFLDTCTEISRIFWFWNLVL